MKSVKWMSVGLGMAMLASTLTGCSTGGRQDAEKPPALKEPQELTLDLTDQPDTLDLSKATLSPALDTLSLMYEGLTRLDKSGKPVPGVAASWEHSSDFKTWTFHLRKNAKWSDGSAVTAKDFVYSLLRTLDKTTNSDYEFMAAWVKNGDAYNAGKVSKDEVGIKAKDDYTLVYTLENPIPFFDSQTAFPVFYPLNQKAVEAGGDKYGTDINNLVGNGPWRVQSWNQQAIVLSKSDTYWDHADKSRFLLSKITLDILNDPNTRLTDYQSGAVDRVSLVKEQVDQYRSNKEFSVEPTLKTNFLEFNPRQAPVLASPKVRRALVWAIDRGAYADSIYHNGSTGATGLVPAGTSDGIGGDYRKLAGDLIGSHAPDECKSLLNDGLKDLNMTSFPKISLLSGDDPVSKEIGSFIQNQWMQNLGIKVDLLYLPIASRLKVSRSGEYDIAATVWGADYNDPMTFLDMWTSNSSFNEVSYANPDYDKLINDARVQTDLNVRAQDYVNAEKILMNDMPIGPLVFRSQAYLTKPFVHSLITSASGVEFNLDYAWIQGRKK